MDKKKNPEYKNHYKIEFSPQELSYTLFSKKICPVCGKKLKKVKSTKEYVGVENIRIVEYAQNVNMNHIILQYKCEQCDQIYSVKELLELNKNKNN